MVDRDYKFTVFPSDLKPYGAVGKENLDVIRLTYDFSCYLESAETIQQVEFPTIQAVSSTIQQHWRQDYPVQCEPDVDLEDTYKLKVVSEAITNMGKSVEIRVNAGTPMFTYVLSFLAVASTTRRRKQVDTLVVLEKPINDAMVSPGDLDPDVVPPLVITSSTALPMGFDGLVILQNPNLTGIVITLPPNPILGQMLEFIDAYGKDGTYPVTFRGDGDVPIDGDGRLSFVSSINYDCLRWKWTGSNWHLMAFRFGFMG